MLMMNEADAVVAVSLAVGIHIVPPVVETSIYYARGDRLAQKKEGRQDQSLPLRLRPRPPTSSFSQFMFLCCRSLRRRLSQDGRRRTYVVTDALKIAREKERYEY